MLKTSGNTESKTQPDEGGVRVGGDSKTGYGKSGIDDGKNDGGEVGDDKIGKKAQKLSKSKNLSKSDFFTPVAKLAFTKLRQAFIKAPIFHHFDPEHHIRIEMNVSGYAIGRVFSQLTLDYSGRWHPVTYFSRKMILAETGYETYDGELLAIIEAFKTWRHYLEGS